VSGRRGFGIGARRVKLRLERFESGECGIVSSLLGGQRGLVRRLSSCRG
jgi:hypothetical protein